MRAAGDQKKRVVTSKQLFNFFSSSAEQGAASFINENKVVDKEQRIKNSNQMNPAPVLCYCAASCMETCRASIEKMLCDQGDPRFTASYARMAEQQMDRDKGEKREAEEE